MKKIAIFTVWGLLVASSVFACGAAMTDHVEAVKQAVAQAPAPAADGKAQQPVAVPAK